MIITDTAKEMLTNAMTEKNAQGIRFHFVGQGCCGPQLGLSLDEPQEKDVIKEVNGVQVAIDQRVLNMAEEVTIDMQNGSLTLVGVPENC
ncbi:iron-sulfur cluster biosynthesis family protein [Paenisporosarcina sp. TG20]|uniref:iron-sulfur cluster biosynthesis family protein n=1 Tax=Paenisporosarcina sp. TG20 TaxID=1211706 RepID=UPI0002EF3507|nr:iron-sulfur cluster biosynthesis family protein [Paenisporosarcina sp. TG20]